MHRWIQGTAVGLLAQMLLTHPLWWWRATDAVPPVPLLGSQVPEWLLWSTGMLPAVLAIGLLIRPDNRYLLQATAIALGCSAAGDLNRFQPWVYWYVLAFFAASARQPLPALRVITAGMYAWGGLHKLTPWFAADNFEWFCSAFEVTKALATPALGYAVAGLEALLGAALLYAPTRKAAACTAIGMHLWIILVLSPLGLDWNKVVIPWNAVLIGTLLLLFLEDRARVRPPWALALWMLGSPLLPGLPRTMGWHLYNNTQPEAVFVRGLQPPTCAAGWDALAYDHHQRMLLDDWAMHTLGVPLLHGDKVFRALHRHLCGCSTGALGTEILRVDWRTQKDREPDKWPCQGPEKQMSGKVD
jgi:hypothetical protein